MKKSLFIDVAKKICDIKKMSEIAKNWRSLEPRICNFCQKILHRLTKCIILKSIFVNDLSLTSVRIPLIWSFAKVWYVSISDKTSDTSQVSIRVWQKKLNLNAQKGLIISNYEKSIRVQIFENQSLDSRYISNGLPRISIKYRVVKENLSFYSTIKDQILLDDPVVTQGMWKISFENTT